MGCSLRVFFHRYFNTCPGVLTLYRWYISDMKTSEQPKCLTSVATESECAPLAIPILVGILWANFVDDCRSARSNRVEPAALEEVLSVSWSLFISAVKNPIPPAQLWCRAPPPKPPPIKRGGGERIVQCEQTSSSLYPIISLHRVPKKKREPLKKNADLKISSLFSFERDWSRAANKSRCKKIWGKL